MSNPNSEFDNERNDNDDGSSPPIRRRSRLRSIALALILGSILGIGGAVTILAISHREKWPTITMADLDAAASRWSANAPANYDMDLALAGMTHGTAHVEVCWKRDEHAT